MCLSNTLGMLSGPRALWLCSWWRASWKIAGVILPNIIWWFGDGPAGIVMSQGKGSSGLICLSGDRILVYFVD